MAPPATARDPGRILIVRLSHLGDVVCALPVFHALREAHPRAEIGWAVQPEFAGLLDGMEGLARIFRFGRGEGLRAWRRLRAELRAFRPDLVVDCQANLKSAAATWLSGAPRRAGLHPDDWRERPFGRVLNEPAPRSGGAHVLERMLDLARHAAPAASHPPRTDAGLSPAERAEGERRLEALLPRAGPGDAILCVSAPDDPRAWPLERWRELARLLASEGRRVLLLAGPRERASGRELARSLEGAVLWEQEGLRELAAALEAAARCGVSFVGCDSGPMHLACASGAPVLALAGPQDPARTGPWSREGGARPERAVRAPEPPPCAPCRERRCAHEDGNVCMQSIGAERVAAALEGLATAPARGRAVQRR